MRVVVMAPKRPCFQARAALAKAKAAAKAKAKAVAKAKGKAKARARPIVARRVDPNAEPPILTLLREYAWSTASMRRNGRSVETVAAHMFQNCNQVETYELIGLLWYRAPTPFFLAVKERWDAYMAACARATSRGIGHCMVSGSAMGVSQRGAVMGFA